MQVGSCLTHSLYMRSRGLTNLHLSQRLAKRNSTNLEPLPWPLPNSATQAGPCHIASGQAGLRQGGSIQR